ncbi:MAG: adenylate/guanylate cyclase domain-containing protein [Kiloniellales bacterium]
MPVSGVKRRLTTILSADVAGYSRLMGEDEEATLRVLTAYREAMDGLIARHDGRVVGTAGDSVLAEFTSPVEAVRCAVTIQQEIEKRNSDLPGNRRMYFRIGVNLGDVMAEGDDIYGDGVNVAARLQGLADPGGMCVSQSVFDQVKNKVGVGFESLGKQALKNIAEPITVYRAEKVGSDLARAPEDEAATERRLGTAIQEGREALQRHAWSDAFAIFAKADAAGSLSPEELEMLAESAWWSGQVDDCINALERAYTAHLEGGHRGRAAMVSIALAEHHFHKLAHSVGSAWLMRAERLLEDEPESVEHGYLARFHAVIALEADGDLDRALELAERVLELGTRFSDRDLRALALQDRGRIMIANGRVEEGMALMEEAMVSAVAGELGVQTTGRVYCNILDTCGKLADYRRAGEWDDAAKRWCVEVAHGSAFPGICRVKRAEIMRLRGAWAEAEQEAHRACEDLRDALDFAAQAFAEIGQIRLHMGDLGAAEEAFRQAHRLGCDPEPGLARLRLAEGKAEAAQTLIDRALANESLTRLDRAPLLAAQIEIALAVGDLSHARLATDELRAIAEVYTSNALAAAAAYGMGTLQLAEDHPEAAVESLQQAWKLWHESGVPYEEARSRLPLGLAYRAQGADELAELEFDTARSIFERLGATLDLRRAQALLGHGTTEP